MYLFFLILQEKKKYFDQWLYTFFTQIVVDGEQRRDEKNGWCALCTLFYTTDVVEAKALAPNRLSQLQPSLQQ